MFSLASRGGRPVPYNWSPLKTECINKALTSADFISTTTRSRTDVLVSFRSFGRDCGGGRSWRRSETQNRCTIGVLSLTNCIRFMDLKIHLNYNHIHECNVSQFSLYLSCFAVCRLKS